MTYKSIWLSFADGSVILTCIPIAPANLCTYMAMSSIGCK